MLRLFLAGRIVLDKDELSRIKKVSGVSSLSWTSCEDGFILSGSREQVLACVSLLKGFELVVPDFSKCVFSGDEFLALKEVRRAMRDVVEGGFEAQLLKEGLCARFGKQAQRMATPKTSNIQVVRGVKEMLECLACSRKKGSPFPACSVISANSQRQEAKYREDL